MRKEMDELKNEMREKTNKNLDGMVKMTDSPFTPKILECHLRQSSVSPNLSSLMA